MIGAVAIAALLIGGASSWVASGNPDGLEWSMERVAGSGGLGSQDSVAHKIAAALQGALSFMPHYAFKDGGSSLAGIIGSLILLGAAIVVGLALRRKARG